MVSNSLQYMNEGVILLGSALHKGATKFSAKGEDNHSTVNITISHGKCSMKCTNGMCLAVTQTNKKLPKSTGIKDRESLCSHLQTMAENIDFVKSFFPHYFTQRESETARETEENGFEIEQENTDDVGLQPDKTNFNVQTGLWSFKGLSTHKPKDMMSDDLCKYTRMRNCGAMSDGCTMQLKQKPRDDEGNLKMCDCGAGYSDEVEPIHLGTATLYTRVGAIPCKYYKLMCKNGKCEINFHQLAESIGLFFSTGMTCAGDEIGWDFVQSVLKFKTSFSGYCAEMTRRYITAMDNAPHFMSPNTFINWFFAWLASMKIDFKQHINPQCGHDPPMLACDGTHIGVSIMNMELERTVTGIDLDKEIKPKHKRLDRVLIHNKTTRKHLRYMCNKKLSKLAEDEILTIEKETRKTQYMLTHIQVKNDPIVHEFIQLFISGNKEDVFHN